MSLETLLARYLPSIEEEMRAVVQTSDPHHAGLFGMLHYHMGWADDAFKPCQPRTGKRIRPMLCLLTCEACGGDWEQALPAATAIELMHNFTLIHDDIEDQDDTRHGRSTVWTLWGEAQAINAGDTLFALSQLALLRLAERGVPAAAILESLHCLNHTCVDITAGQYLDIGFENRDDVPITDYVTMVEGKTAALAACACGMGTIIAAAPAAQRERLGAFGYHMGLAFQMRDDVLGIWGDTAITGKPAGADIARRKKSLPILHGMEQSAELRVLLARDNLSADDVHHATGLLEEADSRAYTEQLMLEHHSQALVALEESNVQGPAAQALHELAQALLYRER